jgi:hypothetical protein
MTRQLAVATAAWVLAVLAAIVGVVLPRTQHRLALGLFVFAVVASVGVAILLLLDGVRRRPRRPRAPAPGESPLDRLEYLPAVTTRTRRLQWRGGRHLVGDRPPTPTAGEAQDEVDLVGTVQPRRDIANEVTGSAYQRPASSTTPLPNDAAEASPRAP